MPKIESYEQLLEYLNRLGFAGGKDSSIQHQQDMLCCAADAIEETSGCALPFQVGGPRNQPGAAGKPDRFSIRILWHYDVGRCPWLSTFRFVRGDGAEAKPLSMGSVSFDAWLKKQGRR